jgi:hypothetical protein
LAYADPLKYDANSARCIIVMGDAGSELLGPLGMGRANRQHTWCRWLKQEDAMANNPDHSGAKGKPARDEAQGVAGQSQGELQQALSEVKAVAEELRRARSEIEEQRRTLQSELEKARELQRELKRRQADVPHAPGSASGESSEEDWLIRQPAEIQKKLKKREAELEEVVQGLHSPLWPLR